MAEMLASPPAYILGQDAAAVQRLLRQGRLLDPFTRRMLKDAGVSPGMAVLDVGCGAGDISLLAAELVGKEGYVLGVDNNATVLELAQARAEMAGLSQVSFQAADIHELVGRQQFDAIVGRLILLHVPEPATLLRQLLTHLRQSGLVAFQEYDAPPQTDAALPASPLWDQVGTWCRLAFQRGGADLRMGMKLPGTFLEAGLPAPQLRYEAAIGAGPGWEGYEWLADLVRVLTPLILEFGIAKVEDIEIEGLAERLREEIEGRGGVAHLPALVSAWTHKGLK
jgi:SAM-dependent methyltransferase